MWSLSYHPASGNIALGLADGRVEMWQTVAPSAAPQAAPRGALQASPQSVRQSAPRAASQAAPRPAPQAALRPAPQVTLPAHACVRERLAAAKAQANDIQASLSKAENELRQQTSREQELKRSIADLEAKRTYTLYIARRGYLHTDSGERKEGT